MKQAADRFAAVESRFLDRLTEDPLPEGFGDLHATLRYLELIDEQSALKSKVKDAETALDRLAYRYATPLPDLVNDVEGLAARVDGHLQRMGFIS